MLVRVNEGDPRGWFPLHNVGRGCHKEIAELLITNAAVLMVGCATTQLVKESPTVKAPDISIHQAAEEGKIEAVKQHFG